MDWTQLPKVFSRSGLDKPMRSGVCLQDKYLEWLVLEDCVKRLSEDVYCLSLDCPEDYIAAAKMILPDGVFTGRVILALYGVIHFDQDCCVTVLQDIEGDERIVCNELSVFRSLPESLNPKEYSKVPVCGGVRVVGLNRAMRDARNYENLEEVEIQWDLLGKLVEQGH